MLPNSPLSMVAPTESAALEAAKNPKYGVVPRGFSVEETVGRPWYEREGINRQKLDDIIREAAGGQEITVRKAAGGPISNGARTAGSDGGSAQAGRKNEGLIDAIFALRKVAEEHDIYKPQLAALIRQKTPALTREQASTYANSILNKSVVELSANLRRNPKAMPILNSLKSDIKRMKGEKLMVDLRQALKNQFITG